MIRVLASLALVSIAIGLSACGGGGSNSHSASGAFTPDQANPGTNTISLNGAVGGADLDLTVTANAVSASIFGAAFDLTYDPNVVTYVGYSNGVFLEQAGPATYAVAALNGRLIVGVSGQRPGTGASGTGSVVTLHFQATAAGSSAIVFENQALCSSASAASCDRWQPSAWYGGTYSIH